MLGGATVGSNGSSAGRSMASHIGLPGLGQDVPWHAQARSSGTTSIIVCSSTKRMSLTVRLTTIDGRVPVLKPRVNWTVNEKLDVTPPEVTPKAKGNAARQPHSEARVGDGRQRSVHHGRLHAVRLRRDHEVTLQDHHDLRE